MRTPSRAFAGTAAALVAGALVLAAGSGGRAAPAAPRAASAVPVTVPGDSTDAKVKDNRVGRAAPTSQQRERASAAGARARWNALGTPATLTASARPLASGSAGRPGRRRPRVRRHQPRGARPDRARRRRPGAGDRRPDGRGRRRAVPAALRRPGRRRRRHAVRRRPRRRGLARQLVAGPGRARRRRRRRSPRPTAEQVAVRDAGVSRRDRRCAPSWSRCPLPDRRRAPAYEVVLGADLRGADPVAYATYVDARDGAVLVRENLVDSRRGQPGVGGLPELAADRLLVDRHPGALVLRRPDRAATRSSARRPRRWPWDVDPATGAPTNTTNGNNAIAVHNWDSNDPFTVGTETATPRPDRDYVYPWTNQWYEERCNPDTTFTSPQRNDIDAARANLFAMHNRMHDWSYHLGFTEATWNMQRDNFGLGRARQRPGAGQRPGRRGQRRPARRSRPRQRQPDHARRRHRADHQHVPVAADRRRVLRARASTATSTCR